MKTKIDVPISAGFTRFSRFRLALARGFAVLDILWAVRLCLRRLTLSIEIGSRTYRHRIRVYVDRREIYDFHPPNLPTWSADDHL